MEFEREEYYLQKGYDVLVGIDEVGRGPWAGPMYICGYVFSLQSTIQEGIRDSKLLSRKKRENLHQILKKDLFSIEIIAVEQIDNLGLGGAISFGLKNLIDDISQMLIGQKVKFLVDGQFKGEWGDDVEFIINGDEKVYVIACASIVAKVERDNFMFGLAKKYPEYGFDKHVGYGTKKHLEALKKHGIIDGVHRKSFKPIGRFI